METDRAPELYQHRRVYEPVDVGRKRPRPDARFLPRSREFERTPLSPNTPIKNLASPALSLVSDIYDSGNNLRTSLSNQSTGMQKNDLNDSQQLG